MTAQKRKSTSPLRFSLIGAALIVVGILTLLNVFQLAIAAFSISVGVVAVAFALLLIWPTHSQKRDWTMFAFERFTDRANKVMQLACHEAYRYNHEYIGTEHILLGLVKDEGSGVAANVLKSLDIDLRKVRLEVEKFVQPGPDLVTMGKLHRTARAQKVIEFAIEEANNLMHNYVGTEHLLLGLLRENEGVAAQVLINLAVKLDDVRAEVLTLLQTNAQDFRKSDMDSPIYDRFTDRARKVIQLANQEAHHLNHEYIGTEHILLGLVKEGTGVAANVLKNLDIDLPKLRVEVEKIVQTAPDTITMGKLPQTPRAKKIFDFAIEEASALNHNYVGTEHLLLGLLRESEQEETVAAQVLINLGLKLQDVRQEILVLLDHDMSIDPGTP